LSNTQRATRRTGGEASRRKFVEPTVVRHGGLARVTAQQGGDPVITGAGDPVVYSAPAIGSETVR